MTTSLSLTLCHFRRHYIWHRCCTSNIMIPSWWHHIYYWLGRHISSLRFTGEGQKWEPYSHVFLSLFPLSVGQYVIHTINLYQTSTISTVVPILQPPSLPTLPLFSYRLSLPRTNYTLNIIPKASSLKSIRYKYKNENEDTPPPLRTLIWSYLGRWCKKPPSLLIGPPHWGIGARPPIPGRVLRGSVVWVWFQVYIRGGGRYPITIRHSTSSLPPPPPLTLLIWSINLN